MRNVWKGLVIGGLTGVAAGLVVDAAAKGGRLAGQVGSRAVDHAPEVAERLRAAIGDAGSKVRESDAVERVKEKAADAAAQVKEQVKERAAEVKDRAAEAAATTRDQAADAAAKGRDRAQQAAERAGGATGPPG